MVRRRTEKLANAVGVVTLGFGVVLTAMPRRSAAALGLGDRPVLAGAVGLTDLVVGSGVLLGRPRWPWMAARAALNLVLTGCYAAEANRPDGNRRARSGAIAMASLTVVDTALALALAKQRGGERASSRTPARPMP
ncbi:hypothetical protein ACGFH8_05600 [Micromonospora sp. NPDC049175]|uniref:hypothetical protein n=1 Tax=Micromonospora sp. NPDC049175 TaxID=3364266 RepID=UPI0037209A5F